MSATFVVCVALVSSLMIWLIGERFPLALDRETARRSDSKAIAPIPRIVRGTDGAAGHDADLRVAIASPVEPNGVVETSALQASLVGVQTANHRKLQARWITYQRRRTAYISKVALSVVHITNAPREADGSPSRPSPTDAELAQGERLLDRGQQFLAQGNIVIAREYFARAAALGLPIAALRLGETHDPLEFRHLQIFGLKHDPAEARRWYERAIELGANEAEAKLRRLGTR
jgi:hypothetical protein